MFKRSRLTTMRSESLVIWKFLWIFLYTTFSYHAFTTQIFGVDGTSNDDLCPSIFIRNTVADLERLEKCRVIEGSLQISLIQYGTPLDYKKYSFPKLREITGYFLVTLASGLRTLGNLFPNLSVIRGQDLIYNYAFIITDTSDMHEIGLHSLTNIMERGVYIAGNPNLCYVDTIDWNRITSDSSVNVIQKNKPSDQCPNLCPVDRCPKAESDARALCWSHNDCQIVHRFQCPGCGTRPCTDDGLCCDSECLGGCHLPDSNTSCFVCKNVELLHNGNIFCRAECPPSTYEYLNRRCVTEDECRSITSTDPRRKKLLFGKLLDNYNGKDVCVLECPKNYMPVIENGTEHCKPCAGPCRKSCPGLFVDSIESSVALKGCTSIHGTLKIQIRGYSPNLVRELENNLDMIQEIEGSLVIANSHSLSSLNFLKSLKEIHGNILEENMYAVVVKSNDNVQELWNRTQSNSIQIKNPEARVLFHYNPKLCPETITHFVSNSGINSAMETNNIDIGVTNGDKVPCDKAELALRIRKRTDSTVHIQWENFRRNLTDPRHLLNYEVYYKISPERTAFLYEDRDPCGADDWKVMDVPKMSFNGSLLDEPHWQTETVITKLTPYTQYALYVKTVVIPDRDSPNNNIAAQSHIHYFTTLPWIPSPPRTVTLVSNSSHGIVILWLQPTSPNGIIEKYQIYVKENEPEVAFLDQRNYCDGRPNSDVKTVFTDKATPYLHGTGEVVGIGGKDCCSCPAPGFVSTLITPSKTTTPTQSDREKSALFEQQVQDAIMNAIFIENPSYKATDDEPENLGLLNSTSILSRRRRSNAALLLERELSTPIASTTAEDSQETGIGRKTFPDNTQLEPISQLYSDHMTLNVDVMANRTNLDGRTIYFLSNLTHYTRYTIGLVACRAISSDIENDIPVCSSMVKETITTMPSETADYVNVNSIQLNVTGNEVRVSWDEPLKANGIVMSYYINLTRVDSSKTNEPSHIYCITRKHFNESGRNYTFPKGLHPGNYSFRVQVISLSSQLANYSTPIYFLVRASDDGMSPGQVMAIVFPILIFFIMAAAFLLYFLKTRKLVKKITSANPEYLQNVDIPDEFELSREKIELIKELGKGAFGMVYEGIIKDFKGKGKVKCAVKQVAKGAPSEDRYRFLQEANIMTQMDCHHIIRLLGVVSVSQPTYVIMELMLNGDLKKYLRQRRPDSSEGNGDPPPTLKQILRMAAEIADGMAYLDSKGFVHRDLAARNCMVAEDLTVKVGDFGMTKDTDYYRKSTRGLLPVRWMAPESIVDGIFTIQSDLWSFGVVLWEMATLAAQPYQGLNHEQVLRYVKEGGIMERPENCPDILYNVMLRCWAFRCQDRPSFADILHWLDSEVDPSFAQVSFYHSSSGIEYRTRLHNRPTHDEHYPSAKTPLRATFEDDLISVDEYGGNTSSEDDEPALLHRISGDRQASGDLESRFPNQPQANGRGTLFCASELPSAFHSSTNTPSNFPKNHSSRSSPHHLIGGPSSTHLTPLDLQLNNRDIESYRNNNNRSIDQIQLIPSSAHTLSASLSLMPPISSSTCPGGGNCSNSPSVNFNPAANEDSLIFCNGLGVPSNNLKAEVLPRCPSQRPLNGFLPSNTTTSEFTNPSFNIRKNKSTTEF